MIGLRPVRKELQLKSENAKETKPKGNNEKNLVNKSASHKPGQKVQNSIRKENKVKNPRRHKTIRHRRRNKSVGAPHKGFNNSKKSRRKIIGGIAGVAAVGVGVVAVAEHSKSNNTNNNSEQAVTDNSNDNGSTLQFNKSHHKKHAEKKHSGDKNKLNNLLNDTKSHRGKSKKASSSNLNDILDKTFGGGATGSSLKQLLKAAEKSQLQAAALGNNENSKSDSNGNIKAQIASPKLNVAASANDSKNAALNQPTVRPVVPSSAAASSRPATPATPSNTTGGNTAATTPTTPSTPVNSGTTVGPSRPVTPNQPGSNITPSTPGTSTVPVHPVNPGSSTVPVHPVNPGSSTAPVQPVNPGSSSTPGSSATPGSSSTPGSSATPGTSDTPGSSATPGTSDTPGSSATPGTSGTPGSSATPGTSDTPGSSATPGTSDTPGSSATPGTSGTPGSSVTPGTSGTPGSSATPGTSGTPGSSATSGTSDTPGSSATPGTSDTPGSSATPGTSDSKIIETQASTGTSTSQSNLVPLAEDIQVAYNNGKPQSIGNIGTGFEDNGSYTITGTINQSNGTKLTVKKTVTVSKGASLNDGDKDTKAVATVEATPITVQAGQKVTLFDDTKITSNNGEQVTSSDLPGIVLNQAGNYQIKFRVGDTQIIRNVTVSGTSNTIKVENTQTA